VHADAVLPPCSLLPGRELIEREREREGLDLKLLSKKRGGYHWYHHPSDELRTIFAETCLSLG